MIQTIIDYLNLRVETLGRIAHLYGITEKRKRSGDDAAIPYAYVGAGQFEPVDIDNGNAGWWRPRSGFTMEPVEVIGRAVKQQRASYPLRFVAVLRRDLSVADDAFMPSRLAEDISNAFNFDNGDLRNILKALNVEARTSSVEFDASAIWATEFHTSISDLHYELAMVAVDVTIEVVAKYSCWEGECATDLDILRLFNFCDPSVVARLSPTQVACLEAAICPTPPTLCEQLAEVEPADVVADVFDCLTEAAQDELLTTECEDATITVNAQPFGTVPSGDTLDVPVVNGGSNPVGAEQGGEWVIGNSEVFINAVQVADIVAEDTANLAVELDGVPSGTWNAGTQTWEVTSAPCPDGAVTVNSVAFGNAPSGGSLNVPVKNSAGTLRGSKVGADWVVPDGSVPVTNTAATPITTIAVPSGDSVPYVIPNVSWTDSDGSAESTPYGDAIVCTPNPPVTYPTTAALIKTGQTVSYQSGDDGDFEAGRETSFLVLSENNPFGNTNRFTDLVGGQTYAANIVIDWSTFEKSTGKVLMWERTRQGIVNWTTAVTNSRALTYNGWTNWRLPNVTEGLSLFNYGVLSNPLNYSPFTTNALDGYYWTGTTNPSNTVTALLMGMAVWASVVSTKTNAVRWIAVRTGNISELVIP